MKIDEFQNPPVTEALMLLGSNSKKKIIILEGDSDGVFWDQHVNFSDHNASYLVAEGRENVVEYVCDILERFPDRVLGIIDSDYDAEQRLSGQTIQGVISSTENDVELDVLTFGDFQRCLSPSLSSEKLKRANLDAVSLIDLSVQAAASVGALRKTNKEEELGLCFQCYTLKSRDFPPSRIKSNEWFSISKIVEKYLSQSANIHKGVDKEKTVSQCETLFNRTDSRIKLCRGHDVSLVLAVLHNHFKKAGRSDRNQDDLNDLLLGHISTEEFSKTPIHQDLVSWLSK